MTLEDIKAMPGEIITPDIAAQILGCDPQFIRVAARDCPEILGFPVLRIGRRTKIPKRPFVQFFEGRPQNEQDAKSETA